MQEIVHPLYGKIKPLEHNTVPNIPPMEIYFSCDRKLKFSKEHLAEKSLNRLRASGKDSDPTRELEVYKCRFCPYYHVGHRPKPKPRRQKKVRNLKNPLDKDLNRC